ncbi:MAG: hypothetical protein RL120_05835, partial [Gammaproteobacteria bacterium]
GGIAALLIVWLALLGIRKRSFNTRLGKVRAWVSAHVYLGTSLIIIASFHSAFQVGLNIHTLAYCLMLAVIFSGFYGVFAYIRYPAKISALLDDRSDADNLVSLNELTRQIMTTCENLDSELQMTISSAIDRTYLGKSMWSVLRASDFSAMHRTVFGEHEITRVEIVPNPDQQPLIDYVAKRIPRGKRATEPELLLKLLNLLTRRQQLLRDYRRAAQLRARLKFWLFLHTPLSIALVVALIIHVISVFFYW